MDVSHPFFSPSEHAGCTGLGRIDGANECPHHGSLERDGARVFLCAVGFRDGASVVSGLSARVGQRVGRCVCLGVGLLDGLLVDGLLVGDTDGEPLGLIDGLALGDVEGDTDGLPLGDTLGLVDGLALGE